MNVMHTDEIKQYVSDAVKELTELHAELLKKLPETAKNYATFFDINLSIIASYLYTTLLVMESVGNEHLQGEARKLISKGESLDIITQRIKQYMTLN